MMDRHHAVAQIDQAMGRAVRERVFPGAVLAWGVGKALFFHRAYGIADETSNEPVKPNTIFDVASLTKPLATTLALADLVKEKKVTLFTPLADILPGVRDTDKSQITVEMLLRHTSGLPAHREYFKVILGSNPRNQLRRLILAEPLEETPGKKERYSDLGYVLLAWVVEQISGQRLDVFVHTRIYSPLGLDTLSFISSKTGWGGRAGVASTSLCPWRNRMIRGEVEDENAWAVGGIEGHAGLFGDALSVYRLCGEILAAVNGEETGVLDFEVIQSFVRQIPGMDRVAGFDTPSKQNSAAGRFFSNRALGHLGFTGTSFWLDPDTGLIAVLLTNRVHPSRGNLKIKRFRPLIHDLIYSCVSSTGHINKPV